MEIKVGDVSYNAMIESDLVVHKIGVIIRRIPY
jgi:hypothetical protein